MRTYERNGIHVDQCGECRGIFLDRGELEQLVDAETQWSAPAGAPPMAPPPQQQQGGPVAGPPPRRMGGSYDSPDDYRGGGYGGQGYGGQPGYGKPKKKRARSFLEDLFEG
jgi:Zn-finger nucleic acid-binding protein